MKLFSHLPVSGKLASAFGIVLLLMAGLGGFALYQLSRVYTQTESILTYRLPGVRDGLRMAAAATYYRQREFRLLLTEPADVPDVLKRIEASKAAVETARKSYASAIASSDEQKLYDDAMAGWKDYLDQSQKAIAQYTAGQRDEARATLAAPEGIKRFNEVLTRFDRLNEFNDSHATRDAEEAAAIFRGSRIGVFACLAVAIALATALGWAIARAIANPLRQAVALAEAVSGGDLTQTPSAEGRDETAQLTRALGQMVARLRTVVSEVRSGVDAVGTASSQIATGNLDLSQRTEEQASNLQQTAASMEQITATVRNNADNARAASQLAAGATDVAKRGGQVVGNVVATMEDISASSKKIADIIGTIDGIAFQTNILALNAAVEAARAGEQGRGFAVVASEVRSLAQRSAGAAKEIKGLIEQSVQKVETGTRLVAEAGSTMSDIVDQVQRVNDLVGEISTASAEQSTGIGQVGDAVAQLDQVTQQNAALVEESAAAADSMKHQAEKLALTVSVFNVGDSAQGTPYAQAQQVVAQIAAQSRSVPAVPATARRAAAPALRKATPPAANRAPAPAPALAHAAEPEWENF